MRRAAGAVSASLWAVVTVGGCCTSPPASVFLPQDDHYTSLRGFLYAIEVGQWDEAYSRLTKESQRDFSATDMWLAFWAKLKIPGTDVPIADLIQKHDPFYRVCPETPSASTVEYPLIYDPEEGPGEQDYFYGMSIILVRKPVVIDGEETYIWEIDLLRSVTQG